MQRSQVKKWLKKDNLLILEGWKRQGLSNEQIANNIGINRKTLGQWAKKHAPISNALKKGKEVTRFEVENALYDKAINGNVTAMIFWLKNNWSEKYNDSKLSIEEKEVMIIKKKKLSADMRIAEAKARLLEKATDASNERLEKMLSLLEESAKEEEEQE
ncbi:small terminase subunit [Lactobacillus mulieris]|uniref:small terminase subunit n=1 Tax=Lactobacillus mulieris TaxID=2508708 RepID=UPI0022ABCA3A|nr:small terminase subunit [Lactobacillus mulieris]MCZ3742187.1 DNA-packaging protein [Lactobacillus mulieris]MCZ3749025.1 DNA-packaging protein [Lactobacillus mulieris]MCZ3750654.1 DNA-packaging protein [Lactobacillus mulieris]MDT9629383.1 small terminase subunit [Lactobacillus mulieris]